MIESLREVRKMVGKKGKDEKTWGGRIWEKEWGTENESEEILYITNKRLKLEYNHLHSAINSY